MDPQQSLTDLVLATFRANGLLLSAGDDLVAPERLSSARWQVMGAIALAEHPLTVPQIARQMGLTRQSVHISVGKLEAAGLVELVDNADHRRSQLVALTNRGEVIYRRIDRRWRKWAAELSEGLDPEELQTAARVLEQLVAKLERGSLVGG